MITREIGQLDGCFQKNKTKRKDREKGKKSRSLKGVFDFQVGEYLRTS